MRDVIYNELMKVFAYRRPDDPVYISNTCSDLAEALADFLESQDDWYDRAVLDEVAYRISLVFDSGNAAFTVSANILNALGLDVEHDDR